MSKNSAEYMREYQRQRRAKQDKIISGLFIDPTYKKLLKKNPVAYKRYRAMV